MNTPNDCSDETLAELIEGDAAAVFTRRAENARVFDLSFEYTSFAPEHSRWTCIDLNTYDGAPDSEAPCTFIGRGASEKQARMDLLDQFADHDETRYQRAKPSPVIHSSPFEPTEYGNRLRDESEDDL